MLEILKTWYKRNKDIVWVSVSAAVIITLLSFALMLQRANDRADKAEQAATAAREELQQTQQSHQLTDKAAQNWHGQQMEAASENKQTDAAARDLRGSTDRVHDAAEEARRRLCKSSGSHGCHAQ